MIRLLAIFLFSITMFNPLQSQWWWPWGAEEIEIYGLELTAKEITGQNRFGTSSDFYRTEIFKPLISKSKSEFLNTLGSFRPHYQETEILQLFNLSSNNGYYKLLDSIDFFYYETIGFNTVRQRHPSLASTPLFVEFVNAVTSKNPRLTVEEKKALLFSNKYDQIRDAIIQSRFDIIPTTFNAGRKKVTRSTADLKQKLDEIVISSGVTFSNELQAYLYNLADDQIVIEGTYYEARLSDEYISKINYFLSTIKSVEIGDDQFAFYLKRYLESDDAAVNTGLCAVFVSGKYDRSKVSKESIAATLSTKFNIPATEAANLSLSLSIEYSKDETSNINTQFSSAFIIRYLTSKVIDEVQVATLNFIFTPRGPRSGD